MKSSNIPIFGKWFIGFEGWVEHKGPYYLLPSFIFVAMEDLNLQVRGSSLSFLIWNLNFQVHFKEWSQLNSVKNYTISDATMEIIIDELEDKYGWNPIPDAVKVREVVENNHWLKQIYANGGEKSIYAIGLLSNMLKSGSSKIKNEDSLSLSTLEKRLEG